MPRTKIEVPAGALDSALAPFELWPAQRDQVLPVLQHDRLIVFLKARQLGISWLTCGYALHQCLSRPGQLWLMFSQGLLEANELARRTSLMYHHYDDPAALPALLKDNTGALAWENGSRVLSLPATKKAGRGFTASGVILDEWAFMLWGSQVLAAVKPTIDAGGQLIIISSADGNGTPYHQLYLGAKAGSNGFTPVFLPWQANANRGPGWRDRIKAESPDLTESDVLREYPETDEEAFTHAAGLVYGEQYRDGGDGATVTEAAEYVPDGGAVYWALDDGYSAGSAKATAGRDPNTGQYVADSHPRAILWCQRAPDGALHVFDESYACLALSDVHIADALTRPYQAPEYVVHGPGSAEIRGRLFAAGLTPTQSTANVEESIKELRRRLAADDKGWRGIKVHPRCRHLRQELLSYRNDHAGNPIKAFDHGPDALRGLVWVLRGWL